MERNRILIEKFAGTQPGSHNDQTPITKVAALDAPIVVSITPSRSSLPFPTAKKQHTLTQKTNKKPDMDCSTTQEQCRGKQNLWCKRKDPNTPLNKCKRATFEGTLPRWEKGPCCECTDSCCLDTSLSLSSIYFEGDKVLLYIRTLSLGKYCPRRWPRGYPHRQKT